MNEDGDTLVDQEIEELTGQFEVYLSAAIDWFQINILTLTSLYQLGAIFTAFVVALMVRQTVRRLLAKLSAERSLGTLLQRLLRTLSSIAMPLAWVVALALAEAGFRQTGLPTALLHLFAVLLRAYIVIRVATIFIPSAYWSGVFAWVAWMVAALNAVGLLDPLIETLRGAGFTIGEAEVNLWAVVKGVLLSAGLVWLAYVLSEMIQRRLERAASLNVALQLLVGKITRIVLIVIAVVVGLAAVGVDLTAFAVFSGAVGIGVGLGMQRTISNLVASFSLLADKSLKPGDVIEVETTQGPTYGVVGKMTTRYVSVRTRDGSEILLPNETLISSAVTNWSYSDKAVRRRIPIGVSYNADVELARQLCLKAAAETPRVLKTPKPVCLIKGFGDNSVDLELRLWIDDPEDGVSNVASDVMGRIWMAFRERDVEIPFPQRDLHLRSAVPLQVMRDGTKEP